MNNTFIKEACQVEEGALSKASEASKLVVRLARKITTVEDKIAGLETTNGAQGAETIAVNNVIKIETLQKEIEILKTEMAKLKDSSSQAPKLELNSNNVARWFKTKFESTLQAPESRRYLKDMLDSKLASFQVLNFNLCKISHNLPTSFFHLVTLFNHLQKVISNQLYLFPFSYIRR